MQKPPAPDIVSPMTNITEMVKSHMHNNTNGMTGLNMLCSSASDKQWTDVSKIVKSTQDKLLLCLLCC